MNSINVVCRIRQATDTFVTVDQESYARKIDLITMSAHRRKHMTETLSDKEHTTMMAKRGELNWLATTIHDSVVGTSESHRHVENSHWTQPQRFESSLCDRRIVKHRTNCTIL